MIKKIIVSSIIICMIVMLGGCINMDELFKKFEGPITDQREIFLAHMEEKYDEEFLPISYAVAGILTPEEFRCYVKGTDPERDFVRVSRVELDGQTVIVDDYFGHLIRQDYQDRVQEIATQAAGLSKAYLGSYLLSYFDPALTGEHTLDDAIEMGQNISAAKYIFFEVAPGEESRFQQICDQIFEELDRQDLPGMVKVLGLSQGQLETITQQDYLEQIPSMVKPDGKIVLRMGDRMI